MFAAWWSIDGLNTPRTEGTQNILLMLATSQALHLLSIFTRPGVFACAESREIIVNIPEPLPGDGFSIPLRASFLVFKKFPLLGIATNNAAPRLVVFHDRIEFRVITRQRRIYEDLESVDARQTLGTQNIVLFWRRGLFAFSANLGTEQAWSRSSHFFADAASISTTGRGNFSPKGKFLRSSRRHCRCIRAIDALH